jgi:hypothetical protein
MLLFFAACALAVALFIWHGARWWRRSMVTATVTLTTLAILSYIGGDPVRGPFAYLVHPHAKDTFTFHAGVQSTFPMKQLSDGYDFSRVISFGGPYQAIELWIQKRWPFRWRIKAKLVVNNRTVFEFDDREIKSIDPSADVNYDDTALELVVVGKPVFQVVMSDDSDIYVNAVLKIEREVGVYDAVILNGDVVRVIPLQALTDADFPRPLFRYPAYSHRGKRK